MENNEPIHSFEDWLRENQKYFPDKLKKVLHNGYETHRFIFFWKRYEQLAMPYMYKLLEKQYPTVAAGPDYFAPKIKNIIECIILRVAEYAFQIVKYSSQGLHPSDVFKKEWPHAKEDIYNPAKYRRFYDIDNPPEFYRKYTREKNKKTFEQYNSEIKKGIDTKNAFNAAVIAALQEPLLMVLPQLLDIEADWWIFYRHIMLRECDMWMQQQKIAYYIEYNMGPEWLAKTYKERREELSRRMEEKYIAEEKIWDEIIAKERLF